MERVAFKMKLLPGFTGEYKKRHDKIWPELAALLKETGILDYAIFLDEETNILIGTMKVTDSNAVDNLPGQDVMRQWWEYMSDIMETNPDSSPVVVPLKEVFYLP
jgi:L-rhamnose mutarotase